MAQNKSRGQARLRGQGNRLHLMKEGSKTSHCKERNVGKGRICGIFTTYHTFQGKDGNLSGIISLNQKFHWEERKK